MKLFPILLLILLPIAAVTVDAQTSFEVVAAARTIYIDVTAPPWSATGYDETDDTAAFDSVIAYANANGSISTPGDVFGLKTTRFVILVPDGVYSIPAGLTNSIDVDNVWWLGTSPDGSIIQGQTGTLFKWGGAGQIYGGGMRDLKFLYSAADVNALCLDIANAAHLSFEGIRLRNTGKFAKLGDSATAKFTSSVRFRDVMGYVANLGVPTFDLQNGAGFYLSSSIINTSGVDVPAGTDAHAALPGQAFILSQGTGWDTAQVTDVLINRYYHNLYLAPAAGASVNNWFFSNFLGDYSARGVVLRSAGGNIRNHKYTNCWSVATDLDSWSLEGTDTGVLESVDFVSSIAIISGRHGWNIAKGNKISLDAACESVGQGRLVTGYGVYLDGDGFANAVQNIVILGGRHGLDGAPYTTYTPLQATYGIRVTASALRYTVRDVRASGITDPFSFAAPAAQAASCLVRDNRRIDGAKPTYATVATMTVPASTVAHTNVGPHMKRYYVSGGTVTQIQKGSLRISTGTNMMVELRPGESWTITYTGVPLVVEDILP